MMLNRIRPVCVAAHVAAGVAMIAGCLSMPMAAEKPMIRPKYVSMLTDGVVIRDEAGAWEIQGADPAAPPFYSKAFSWDPTGEGTIDRFDQALKWGAQRVLVEYPGLEKPLYGVLAICPIDPDTKESSAKRAYRMAVPASYVQQARGARISVVYQPYKMPWGQRERAVAMKQGRAAESGSNKVSWILWMSDAPFAAKRRELDEMRAEGR
jgi:hypothetical protein